MSWGRRIRRCAVERQKLLGSQAPRWLLQNIISHGIARIAEHFTSESPTVVAHGFISPFLRSMGETELIDELRVIISEEQGTTAYFTFSSQMRPALHQFRIYGPKNGLVLDQDQETLIKLRGQRYVSYVEKFVPPVSMAKQDLSNAITNVRRFLKRDFHMKSGMKYLIESFYESIVRDIPPPIPHREIILTAHIMDRIFSQMRGTPEFDRVPSSSVEPHSGEVPHLGLSPHRAAVYRTDESGLWHLLLAQRGSSRPSLRWTSAAARPKRVLLISNRLMHYRVSVYNYFWRRFREHGWDFVVLSNELQRQNQNQCQFELIELPFDFFRYRTEIRRINPDTVILFLHLKDWILWPLIHWLKLSGIPVALWTKARNLDDPDNRLRNVFFDYLHVISDGLILYTASLNRFISVRHVGKVFVANNTINFEDFPPIRESKEEIKQDLGIPFQKVVLFAGRIGEERNRKKVDHLIDMFRELDRTDTGLVIVGSGLSEGLRARLNPANTRYLGRGPRSREPRDQPNLQNGRHLLDSRPRRVGS